MIPARPQEARFDRHFVRDLTWSRHQLEELAERRFVAAQQQRQRQAAAAAGYENGGGVADVRKKGQQYSFADLFKAVGSCVFCAVVIVGVCWCVCEGRGTARRASSTQLCRPVLRRWAAARACVSFVCGRAGGLFAGLWVCCVKAETAPWRAWVIVGFGWRQAAMRVALVSKAAPVRGRRLLAANCRSVHLRARRAVPC